MLHGACGACAPHTAALLCLGSFYCYLLWCKCIFLFIWQNSVNLSCSTMLEDEKFFGPRMVYYNTGKSCTGFLNYVWPSLCQDFIVFHRDFIIFPCLLQAVNYYGNYRLWLECLEWEIIDNSWYVGPVSMVIWVSVN